MANELKVIKSKSDDDKLVVANHIVLFGGRDLDGEFFTENTKFDSSYTKTGRLLVDWEHGHDKGTGSPQKNDVLGYVDWSTREFTKDGLWIERTLDRRNEYIAELEPLLLEGLIGTSSEAVPDLVSIDEGGEIRNWGLMRDSFTVNPAEPRMLSSNALTAAKALQEKLPGLKSVVEAAEKAQEIEKVIDTNNGGIAMSETEKTQKDPVEVATHDDQKAEMALIKSQMTEIELANKESNDALSDKLNQVLKTMQESPVIKDSGYFSDEGGKADKTNKSFGDFLLATYRGDNQRLQEVYGSTKHKGEKDMSGVVGTGGGFLVPIEYATSLMAVAESNSIVRPRANVIPVAVPQGQYPALDQFTTVTAGVGDSAYAGGVTAVRTAEGAALTETEPAFRFTAWNAGKMGGVTDVPNELMNDSPISIEQLLRNIFGIAIANKEDYYFLRGSGANEPQGVLSWAGAVGISPASDNAFVLADATAMLEKFRPFGANPSGSIWAAHRSTIPELIAMQTANGGAGFVTNLNDNPLNSNLFGYGVAFSEHLPQENNSGHIMLCDFSSYAIFDLEGLEIAFSEHAKFENDLGTWRFTKRLDGKPWFSDGITAADPQGSWKESPFVYFND